MSKIITVNKLSKLYRVKNPTKSVGFFRGKLFKNCNFTNSEELGAPLLRDFWALRDVSFDVDEGEVVGIVGRNGAGKSTLLKTLSRITAPTEGEAVINGRVGSLLEVGTGFHPELTGRENIFFNGAILGLRKQEITNRFDEIVDFSEVGQFIDTPIKRFSSGMQMRLAFSVAAHLNPEVMIVDEVLAVGDADFQKKCLGKMKDAAGLGRTVLFVSHNMNAIRQLCSRILWMENGRLKEDSKSVYDISRRYLFGERSLLKGIHESIDSESLTCDFFRLSYFRLSNSDGQTVSHPITADSDIFVELCVDIYRLSPLLNFGCAVMDEDGNPVFWSFTTDNSTEEWPKIRLGRNIIRAKIAAHLLNEGLYRVDFISSLHGQGWFSEPGITHVYVNLQISGGLSLSPYWRDRRPGIAAPTLNWSLCE